MQRILSFLGMTPDVAAPGHSYSRSDAIRRIAARIERLDPDRAIYVAAFAYVLSRIAQADHEVTAEETGTMERLVRNKGGLPPDQATLVVQMATTQQLRLGGTDDFLVTRELSRVATDAQKIAIIECLFAVAAADKRIFTAEADEAGRVARELKVDQRELSRIRASYRDHLEVRKGL